MELRLIFRIGMEDYDGKFCGYNYKTIIINVPEEFVTNKSGHIILPEVIGGEWIKKGG